MRWRGIGLSVFLGFVALSWLAPAPVSALREFSLGNDPVENRSWPTGTLGVANLPSRLGHSHGPSAGEVYFAYRCYNTAEFNVALEKFGAILAPRPTRRSYAMDGWADVIDEKPLLLVVHDYRKDVPHASGWWFLKERVDWAFAVRVPEYFHRDHSGSLGGFRSDTLYYRQPIPPPRIDVYVGGDGPIEWKDVKVPSNVRVIDKRAAGAPVDVSRGGVVRGRLFDMATHQAIAGADVVLKKRAESREFKEATRTKSDDTGAFSLEGIPKGDYTIHFEARGHAGRYVGYDNQSGHSFQDLDALLANVGSLSGKVVDTLGNPVPGVTVHASGIWGIDGFVYTCSKRPEATTDENGRFDLRTLPRGVASLRAKAPPLRQKSINAEIFSIGTRPWEKPVEATIVVEGTGTVRGKVVGADGKPPQRTFSAKIEPKGGSGVGTWGGTTKCKEGGAFEFKGVPPGQYFVTSKPHPAARKSEISDPKLVTVTVGGTVDLEIVNQTASIEK